MVLLRSDAQFTVRTFESNRCLLVELIGFQGWILAWDFGGRA